jgi:hypothetical protein
MPGPFKLPIPADLFGLGQPLVPEEAIKGLQDQIDSPTLERSPWEARLRGFGAGALEGLRQQTSPANLAALAANAIPGIGGGFRAAKAAGAIPEALQGLRGASYAPLGRSLAEFAPIGEEGVYNAGRQIINKVADPAEAAYHAILKRGGR